MTTFGKKAPPPSPRATFNTAARPMLTLARFLGHMTAGVLGPAGVMAAVLLGVAAYSSATAPRPVAVTGLSPAESQLLQGLFGEGFDTAAIRKNYYSAEKDKVLATVTEGERNNIDFWGEETHAPDYAHSNGYAGGLSHMEIFTHEATHLWQHRNGGGDFCKVYEYTLAAGAGFDDFCNEQQASIVADYVRRFIQPAVTPHATFYHLKESDLLLARVVEDKFPAARQSRLSAEKTMAARDDISIVIALPPGDWGTQASLYFTRYRTQGLESDLAFARERVAHARLYGINSAETQQGPAMAAAQPARPAG